MHTTISESDADMTATIETDTLRQYVAAIDAITDEGIFDFKHGLTTAVVDPANVAMGEVDLTRDAFESIDGEGRIGVHTGDLLNFLSPGPDGRYADPLPTDPLGETTTLTVDCDRRRITLESGPYSYMNGAIAPDTVRQEPDLPNMDLPLCVEIDATALRAATEFVDGFADKLIVGFEHPNTLLLGGEGKVDDGVVRLTPDDGVRVVYPGDAHLLLSTDYTKDITRSIPTDATVTMHAGEEFPVTFEYTFADGEGAVEYMQAPRIASD